MSNLLAEISKLGPYNISQLRTIADGIWAQAGLPPNQMPRIMRADVYDGDVTKPTILLYREREDWGHFILIFQRYTAAGRPVVEIFDPEGFDEGTIACDHYLMDDQTGLNNGGLAQYMREAYVSGKIVSYNEPKHGPQEGDNSCGIHCLLRCANLDLSPAKYALHFK